MRGFSLTEVMVAAGLGSFVAIGVFNIVRNQVQSTGTQQRASVVLRSAQRARFLMTSDLAQAGFDPKNPDAPANPLTVASNDRFVLQGDYNLSGIVGDPQAGDSPESIEYTYDAASQTVSRNGKPFLTEVTRFSVTYLNRSGVSDTVVPGTYITELSKVRRVRVEWAQGEENGKDTRFELLVVLKNARS